MSHKFGHCAKIQPLLQKAKKLAICIGNSAPFKSFLLKYLKRFYYIFLKAITFYWPVEQPAETLRLHRLASFLWVRVPNSRSRGHEFKSPVWQELSALTKKWEGLSTVVTLMWCLSTWLAWSHDHVSLSGCVTLAAWHVTGRLTCPADTHWHTYLPLATSLHPRAVP